MDWNFISLLLIVLSYQICGVEPRKDWMKWFKSIKLVKAEFTSGRAIGILKNVPTKFEVLTDGLQYKIDPFHLVDASKHGPSQADIIYGTGLILKSKARGLITIPVDLPITMKKNTCGLIITSFQDSTSEFVSSLKMNWRSDPDVPWDLIANPVNGEFSFNLKMTAKANSRVIMFDSVPAFHFSLLVSTISGKNIKIKLAFLQSCRYRNTIVINDCGEKIYQNARFAILPNQVPISIKCPVDCIRTWPCWGFKVYSSDSPICWTATQNFGRYGNGYYTLYKIPMVVFFRSEVNPLLTHGIFCRRSIVKYPGFTFDRKYFDFSVKEFNSKKAG